MKKRGVAWAYGKRQILNDEVPRREDNPTERGNWGQLKGGRLPGAPWGRGGVASGGCNLVAMHSRNTKRMAPIKVTPLGAKREKKKGKP